MAGVGGGLGFAYTVSDYAGYHPTFSIDTVDTDAIIGALYRLRIPHDVEHANSGPVAERGLDAALAAGTTPICTVDRMGLPWHGCVDLIGGANPHPVAVLGGKQILWIDDECVRPTPMERQFFLAAWGWYVRGRHQLVRLAPGAGVSREDEAPACAAAGVAVVAWTVVALALFLCATSLASRRSTPTHPPIGRHRRRPSPATVGDL